MIHQAPGFIGRPLAPSPYYRTKQTSTHEGSMIVQRFYPIVYVGIDCKDEECLSLASFRARFITLSGVERSAHEVYSYFQALLREKCAQSTFHLVNESTVDLAGENGGTLHPEQPAWVNEQKIMDTILSYIPFESQSTTMRLVCQSFKTAAMNQLEKKLLGDTDLALVLRESPDPSDRADERRGWSVASSRDALIEDALRYLFCRCDSCEDASCCPGMKETLHFRLPGGTIDTLNLEEARNGLTSNGELVFASSKKNHQTSKKPRIIPPIQPIQISHQTECGPNLYQLCSDIFQFFFKNRDCSEPAGHYFHIAKLEGLRESWLTTESFTESYPWLTPESFLRRLFLIFTDGTDLEEGHFPEITTATSKIKLFATLGMQYTQEKKIIRFESAKREPMEIVLVKTLQRS